MPISVSSCLNPVVLHQISTKVDKLQPGQSLSVLCSHSKGNSCDITEENGADNAHIIYVELGVHQWNLEGGGREGSP